MLKIRCAYHIKFNLTKLFYKFIFNLIGNLKDGKNNLFNRKFRSHRYRLWQCKLYNFLERPRGWKSGFYQILM